MRRSVFLAIAIFFAPNVRAQNFVNSQPSGRERNEFVAISGGLAVETGVAARDLVSFRDRKWTILTIAQIAAATVDAETSLRTFHRCPTCVEIGISRLVVGRRPDAHKYAVAGLVEIGIEAVAAHYLRNHGPVRKWYWQYVWMLPQSISLYGHTRSDIHNIGLRLRCDNMGLNCY